MQNREKFRYVFTSSNTRQGFYTFVPQLLAGLRCLFILESPPGSVQAIFIRQLGEEILKRGLCVEFWISAYDPLNPEGIFIPEMETAIVSSCLLGPVAHDHIPRVRRIDLTAGENPELLAAKKNIIADLHQQISRCNKKASRCLQGAGKHNDSIKNKAAAHINREKSRVLTNDIIEEIFNSPGKEKHYFASAMTAEGMINYIDTLSHACGKRYLFTGPPGSGKSAILETIAAEVRKRGLTAEYYYSGFDTRSLNAVIIPNFQIALVDAGSLAVNLQAGDEIIDSTQYLDDYDPRRYETEITRARRQCEALLQDARQILEEAQLKLSRIKRIYEAAMDPGKMEELKQGILAEIIPPPGE